MKTGRDTAGRKPDGTSGPAGCPSPPDALLPDALPPAGAGLPPAEREALSRLMRKGMGAGTLRALSSDIAYIDAWGQAAGHAVFPPSRETVLAFIAHHIAAAGDPAPMPASIAGRLVSEGRLRTRSGHAPSTVRRRLSSWATRCRWAGLPHPFADPGLREALRLAIRAAERAPRPHSPSPVTIEPLLRILDRLDERIRAETAPERRLAPMRDRALLATAFASGGRRRSEIAGLLASQVDLLAPLPDGTPSAAFTMGRTKTGTPGARVYFSGRAVEALAEWLDVSAIAEGAVFPSIDRWGNLSPVALSPQSVTLVLRRRAQEAGLAPEAFSAHGLRSGYITSAALKGASVPEVMRQTLHRSMQPVAGYFRDVKQREGKAARLLD